MNENLFTQLNQLNWTLVQSDKTSTAWSDNWLLDGLKAKVFSTCPTSLDLYSGDAKFIDENHCVLWTKKEFDRDIKITFDYTKLDDEKNSVCILYLFAQGEGSITFPKDINKWAELRQIPAMKLYFQHMNLYHISFSAYDNEDESISYIRARQYESKPFLNGTDILPDYDPQDFFKKDTLIHIEAIKKETQLYFKATSPDSSILCHWELNNTNLLSFGRIGIRQMAGRKGRFSNIEIYEI